MERQTRCPHCGFRFVVSVKAEAIDEDGCCVAKCLMCKKNILFFVTILALPHKKGGGNNA